MHIRSYANIHDGTKKMDGIIRLLRGFTIASKTHKKGGQFYYMQFYQLL